MLNMQRSGTGPAPYPRLQAPVYFTKLGSRFFRRRHRRFDPVLGGVRVYTDEEPKEGSKLQLEIFPPASGVVVPHVKRTKYCRLLRSRPPRPVGKGVARRELRCHRKKRVAR